MWGPTVHLHLDLRNAEMVNYKAIHILTQISVFVQQTTLCIWTVLSFVSQRWFFRLCVSHASILRHFIPRDKHPTHIQYIVFIVTKCIFINYLGLVRRYIAKLHLILVALG